MPAGEAETYLQQFDLRRGIPVLRIDTGMRALPRALQAALPGTPDFPAATAISADGQTVWLVVDVDNGASAEAAEVSRIVVQQPVGSQPTAGAVVAMTKLAPLAGGETQPHPGPG